MQTFLRLVLILCCSGAIAPRALRAVSLGSGTDPQGNACDTVSWTDAQGQPRVVWIKNGNPGGFVTRYTWVNNGTPVDARLRENYPPWGFLVLVNHWHPESTGSYVTSCDANNLTVPLSKSVPFAGPHHLVWRGTFRMKMDPAAATSWYNTVQYVFTDGRDDFLFSTAYDSSDMPQSGLWSDMRAPYGEIDWDGNGSSNESLSGIGWGSTYKFKSTEPLGGNLSSNSPWDNTQPNSIPYIWQWKDSTKQDAELAIVQNQRYIDQSAGGEAHTGGCAGFTAPPSSGTKMSDIEGAYKACVAYQMNVYANWTGQRFTWGSVFRNVWGMFGNGLPVFADGHNDALGLYTYADDYPVNAWSWNVLVDRWSTGGQAALVSDTENTYASSLSASLGSVATSGPRGPGNYVAPSTGSMPVVSYAKAGFDPVFRAWRATASGGAATLNFTVSGSLKRPTIILQAMSALPCSVSLDGSPLSAGTGYQASFDAGSNEVYITLLSDLAAGARTLSVLSSCGSPTATPSATRTQTAGGPTNTPSPSITRTGTPTPSPSRTPSATPVPACNALLVDHLEDGNLSNLLGGAWSSYAAAPSSVGAPSAAGAGYAGSANGALHAVAVSGTNSGSQVGSVSTSFASTDLGTKDRLIFWIKASGPSTTWHVNVARAAITDYDHYGANFTAPTGVWTRVELVLSGMAQGGWGVAKPMAWNDVNGLTWYTASVGAYSIELDDISFGCPGPTPTPSHTRTASATRTASPTSSPTPTAPPAGSTATQTPSALLTPCPGDSFGGFLQAGDKILFLGDSITYRGNYTKMVQAHLSQRFPGAGFSFYNAGGPGDAALQVWNRLSAVLAQSPDVVLICLGMNDAYGIGTYQTDYPNYMNQIITTLQANGIRVALLTPGIVDRTLPFPTVLDAAYNTRLRWLADWTLNYAATRSLPVYDINAAMSAADAALVAGLPGTYAAFMIPDGVHPDPAGGWVMGLGALKALGVPDRCGEIVFNSGSAYAEASGPMSAVGTGSTGFDLQLNTLPPVAPAAARKVLPFEPLQAQLNHLTLKASGLPAASYYIVIDGHRSGPVSNVALSVGINLYDHWIAAGSSAGEWHHIELLDAAGQPASVCDPSAGDGLIDDFETPPLGKWLVNSWGGDSWGLDKGTGSSTVSQDPANLVYAAPGRSAGSCLRLSGTADLGPGNPPVWVSYLNGYHSDVKQGVRFWIKGLAGKQVRFQIHTLYEKAQPTEYWNDFGYTFTTSGAWQQISVPYSSLSLPGWGTPYAFDPQEAYNLDWLPMTAGAYDISLDDIEFYCTTATTPTPTRSATPSFFVTPSATQSRSATATRTSSPSPSATASASPTRTGTASATATASASATRTGTASATASATPSQSPSPSATGTVTVSPTDTPYAGTPTETFTVSPTPTETETYTLSATPSASPSLSASQTATLTASETATFSASPTSTASATPSSSSTMTSSASPSASATVTSSTTSTLSASPTRTGTASVTRSATRTRTASVTPTVSTTASPAPASGTPTGTPLLSATRTALPTAILTPTATPTASRTAGLTSTSTPTSVPGPASATPTGTATAALAPATPDQGSGALEVLRAVPLPHPNPSVIRVLLNGPADRCEVRVYTKALGLVAELVNPASQPGGWMEVDARGLDLANGAYFYEVTARRGPLRALRPCVGTLFILR